MKPPPDEELLYLLSSLDPRDRKLGLQLICDALEAGIKVALWRSPAITSLILAQKSSTDVEVRRWLYKFIGLTSSPAHVGYLRGQLRDELDEENRSWAAAALVAIKGITEGTSLLRVAGLDEQEIDRTLLRVRYFRRHGPEIDHSVVNRMLEANDPLDLRWLSLVFGKQPSLIPTEAIAEMNRHDHPDVAEYSLWALTRDPASGLGDAMVFPQDLHGLPGDVRRWFYRLAAKHRATLEANWDVVEAGIADRHAPAREGLAIGLSGYHLPKPLAERVVGWFESESDRGVRRALLKGFITHRSRSPTYRGKVAAVASSAEGESLEFAGLIPVRRRPRPSRLFLVSGRKRAKGAELLGIPDVSIKGEEFFFFLAVDVVGFSERSDSEQLGIFQGFVDSFRAQKDLARLDSRDIIPLFTGDGLILAIRRADNARLPLVAALEIRGRHEALHKYELRFGVHCGTTQYVELSDGNRQVIGHAVNWTARVMSVAVGNQVLISGDYYNQVLHGGRESVAGYEIRPVHDLADKHGNAVVAHEVV